MKPLIQPGDLIIVRRKEGRIKKYDMAVYKGDLKDQYIFHRCIAVREHGYVFAGDHNEFSDGEIPEERVLAVVAKVLHGKEEIDITSWRYRLYCHLRVDFFPLRCLIIRTRKALRRWLRHDSMQGRKNR